MRIEGTNLPGRTMFGANGHYSNIHVGIQSGREPVELFAGDSSSVRWNVEVTVKQTDDGLDFRGPEVQGKRGERFVYLTWGTVDESGRFTMFRRAKLLFGDVEEAVLRAAAAGEGTLVGRVNLTDSQGCPICARVRPPWVTWTCEGT